MSTPLSDAAATVAGKVNVVQVRIVELGQASHFEKMQRARLVTVAVLELFEAQQQLTKLTVEQLGALEARIRELEQPKVASS